MYFQDSATPIAEGIQELHDSIMYYMAIVISLVTYILISLIKIFKNNPISYKYLTHGTTLEVI
jgi:cytochrome c oxidase subunit 2